MEKLIFVEVKIKQKPFLKAFVLFLEKLFLVFKVY